MKLLIGAAYARDPNSGAGGTVYHSIQALRTIGCDVDEFWQVDLGRCIRHGNLYYALELPRAFRRVVADRCAKATYDAVVLSQPHAYLAGRYIRRYVPETLFLNRSHGWEGAVDVLMAKWAAEQPGDVSPPVRWLRKNMRRRLANHQDWVVAEADGMVVGSKLIAGFIQRRYALANERIAVIPHGIYEPYLTTSMPQRQTDRWSKILYVGQFSRIKAPEQVAAILNQVLTRSSPSTGGWVCDQRHHESVRALLNENVRDRVTLYPWMNQDALMGVLDDYGCFLLPSWYEGCAKAPIEAMSRGLVVVATRVGGPADHIRHGENGFLFECGDTAGMSACLRNVMDDPSGAQRIGDAARASVQSVTWRNYALELVRHIERWKSRSV